jgi:hypothetical protein
MTLEIEDLSKAISILTNPNNLNSSNGNLKEQAINYCNQIKSSENGWKICLNYSKESRYCRMKLSDEI